MTIYEELIALAQPAGLKEQAAGVTDQQYLQKLLEVLNSDKITDAQFKGLSLAAANWYNSGINAINGMQPIPNCPGYKGQEAVTEVTNGAPPVPKPATTQAAKRTDKPAPKPEPKKVAKPVVSQKKTTQNSGVIDAIRKTTVQHSDWTTKQITEYLKTNGYPDIKQDTVAVNVGDIKKVIAFAKELGYWNEQGERKQDGDGSNTEAPTETTSAA